MTPAGVSLQRPSIITCTVIGVPYGGEASTIAHYKSASRASITCRADIMTLKLEDSSMRMNI